jgi:hypothetical protein
MRELRAVNYSCSRAGGHCRWVLETPTLMHLLDGAGTGILVLNLDLCMRTDALKFNEGMSMMPLLIELQTLGYHSRMQCRWRMSSFECADGA